VRAELDRIRNIFGDQRDKAENIPVDFKNYITVLNSSIVGSGPRFICKLAKEEKKINLLIF
jgi:hypothetical protein